MLFKAYQVFVLKVMKIDQIRSDHGKEFENSYMESFCTRLGIFQEFSVLGHM